jgi:hypothetical protein
MLFVAAVLSLARASGGSPESTADSISTSTVVLRRGRTVDVRFVGDLKPHGLHVGQVVPLEMAQDILAGGYLVLEEGGPASGHIENLQPRRPVGVPARLRVVIDYATAVGGTHVPLEGVYSTEGADRHIESAGVSIFYCVCGLLIPGEDVIIRDGTVVTCFVAADTEMFIEESQNESESNADPADGS